MILTDPLLTARRPPKVSAVAFLAVETQEVGTVRVENDAPNWLPYVIDRLNVIAGSPDADDVNSGALGRVLEVLRQLLRSDTPTPSVVPCEDGGIQCVWHKAGWDLEVDVLVAETTVWARERSTGTTWGGPLADYREDTELVLKTLSAS